MIEFIYNRIFIDRRFSVYNRLSIVVFSIPVSIVKIMLTIWFCFDFLEGQLNAFYRSEFYVWK